MNQRTALFLKLLAVGAAAGILGAGVRLLDQMVLFRRLAFSTYAFAIGALFLGLGFFVARTWYRRTKEQAAQSAEAGGIVASDGVLTKREEEILLLISHGKTNQQIADGLYISLSTVKTHVANIYSKLGVRRRTQALARAREQGILQS